MHPFFSISIVVDLNDIRRPIQSYFSSFEHSFEQTVKPQENSLLETIWQYVLSKRGKQLRPLLTLLSAAACKGVTDKSIHSAVAMELLHTASLIHDDVVDQSPKRRGMDSIQERWTNKIAVLAGDHLLARVIAELEKIKNQKLIHIVSELGCNLSSGELLQLHHNNSMWIDEQRYFDIIRHKTATLFAACGEAGAVSCATSSRQSNAMRNYGLHLGMCFQLKDDVLDYGDEESIGKPVMNDIRDGKVTLPLIVSLKRAPKQEADAIRAICENWNTGKGIDKNTAEQDLRSFVLKYDGINYVYSVMQTEKQKAVEALNGIYDSMFKQSLLSLLDYAIIREK